MAECRLEQSGPVLVAYLSGEIDHHAAGRLREQIDARILSASPERVVLDDGKFEMLLVPSPKTAADLQNLVLALLNLLGLGFAVWRFVHGPGDERATVVITSLWVVYNLIIVGGALAVAAEVHQVRRTHRVSTRMPAALRLPDGRLLPCTLRDFSSDGAGLELPLASHPGAGTRVHLVLGRGRREFAFPATVLRGVGAHVGLALELADTQMRVDFAQCTFARADAWLDWHRGFQPTSLPRSLLGVVLLGWRGYRRMSDFAPAPMGRAARRGRRFLHWLGSFLPRPPRIAASSDPTVLPGIPS